jgi:hypothetical protein
LASPTKEWKENIKPWLERSKAARTFLIPLLFLTIYRYRVASDWPFQKSFLELVWLWQWDAVLFIIAFTAFVWLRLLHMTRLYDLIAKGPARVGNGILASYPIPGDEVPYIDVKHLPAESPWAGFLRLQEQT